MRKVRDDEDTASAITRAVRGAATIVETLDERIPEDGPPAVLQAGVATGGIMTIATGSAGNERTIQTMIGEDANIVHRKNVAIDAIATGMHKTIKKGRLKAIELSPAPAQPRGARGAHRRATPFALGMPCLPRRMHTQQKYPNRTRLPLRLKKRNPILPTPGA